MNIIHRSCPCSHHFDSGNYMMELFRKQINYGWWSNVKGHLHGNIWNWDRRCGA